MKTKLLFIVVAGLLCIQSGRKRKPEPTSVAIIFPFQENITCTDTLTISYQSVPKSHINDSLRKYLGEHNHVRRVMIGQPSLIIDSLDFTLFPEMRELVLAGDPDLIYDRKYNFMDAPKLKVIRAWQMYGYDSLDPYTISDEAPERFRKIIHKYRPDVKVKRLRNGEFLLSDWD